MAFSRVVKKLEGVETRDIVPRRFSANYLFSSSDTAYNFDSITSLESGRMGMDWARLLAYIAGTVDQELRLRNEYLVAENRILKAQIKGRHLLSDAEWEIKQPNRKT